MLAHTRARIPFVLICFTKTPGGRGLLRWQQFLPESGGVAGPTPKRAERFLFRLCGIGMTEGEGAMLANGAGGMTEGRRGRRNPRTGPAERDRPLHKKESQV